MKKKIFLRSISGFPLGLSMGYVISIILSLIWAKGYYSPCAPELTAMVGSEIHAVILQALLYGILGAGFGASSVIWEMEAWGLVKQTGIYFLIVSVIMMPVAYISYWMEHSVKGVLRYFGIFAFIFIIVWMIQYARARRHVKKMNEALYQRQRNENEPG